MISKHKCEWDYLPVSDEDNEYPLICFDCNKRVKWTNGVVMSVSHYNSYYDESGNLKDENNNPAKNNLDWIGHTNANESN